MNKYLKSLPIIIIILISNIFASDSLTVYGRIIDTSGVGVVDAKIITEGGVVALSDEDGNYMINISKKYVPIDHQDIVVNTMSDYSVTIYNLLGQKVFDEKYHHSDFTQFAWNGMNKRRELVSSGIYFSILEVNNQVVARNKITIVGQEVLNKRPFINTSLQQIHFPKLSKSSDYNYDMILSLEGENFTNISELKVKIDYNGNNDNVAEAEDIVLNTYEIDYITDIDGNTYKTVKIGDQWWMTENLKVTHYRNGDPIPNVTDEDGWVNLTSGAYCYYDNSDSLGQIFGALYNWYTVDDERSMAPEGWHVPTDREWEELAKYISCNNGGYSKNRDDWQSVGTHLKSTYGWENNRNGIDDYCFAGLPCGYRDEGCFREIDRVLFLWSDYETHEQSAGIRYLFYHKSEFFRASINKLAGFSVRCIKDAQ